jgi:enoyl-CoA hydratase/carnithine racemase
VRVVILTGAGERAFVAGADIAEYRGNRADAFAAYQFESRRVFDKLEALPQPTIAAIRGYALGGGFELALCCDLVVCAQSARLGLPEGLLGLSPGGGGSQRLTRAVGKAVASDIMLAARRITGERAFQLGIAVELTAEEALLDTALDRARAMLKLAPRAQAEMKRLIRQGFDAPLAVAQSFEQEVLLRLYGTHDGQEGIEAFLDKRQPEFKGK